MLLVLFVFLMRLLGTHAQNSAKTFAECQTLAMSGAGLSKQYSYFGLEYPAVSSTPFTAQCWLLDSDHGMAKVPDSECEDEGTDSFGRCYGSGNRLALYMLQPTPSDGGYGTRRRLAENTAQRRLTTGWTITSGSSVCVEVQDAAGNSCIEDVNLGSAHYGNNDLCEFTYTGSATITGSSWELEPHSSCGYDFLQVNGATKYCGATSYTRAFPATLDVSGTTTFKFDTDGSVRFDGFQLCAPAVPNANTSSTLKRAMLTEEEFTAALAGFATGFESMKRMRHSLYGNT
jgi:hypothetical protein